MFIHVGAGKTGTSALQEFFKTNREKLQKEGLILPDIGVVRTRNQIAHHKLSGTGSHAGCDVISMWRAISKTNAEMLLLSSETFHNKISNQDGIKFFTEIRSIFKSWEIKIIFYLRRQSQWHQSAYAQWVKGDMQSLTIEEHAKRYKKNLADQVFLFSDIFGHQNIIVRPFEKRQFIGGSIFTDFFQAIGITIDSSYELPKNNPNPRLNLEALEFKRIINSFSQNVEETKLCLKDLLAYSNPVNTLSSSRIHHTHNSMPLELQKQIESENQSKYETIARDFMGRKDGKLFLDSFEAPPNPKETSEQGNEFHRLYAYLFQNLYKQNRNLVLSNEKLKLELEQLKKS